MKNLSASVLLLVSLSASAQSEWVQKNNFPGAARESAFSYSVGGKGYIGTGNNASAYFSDYWEYQPATDQWQQRADFPGRPRTLAACAGFGDRIYVGTGATDSLEKTKDFYSYNISTGAWTQHADFMGSARRDAGSFIVDGIVYLGTGTDGIAYYKDIWKYDPETDVWTQMADFPSRERIGVSAFSIGNRGYMGLGFSNLGDYRIDFFEYRPNNNNWRRVEKDFPGIGREAAASFGSAELGRGYVMCGHRKLNTYIRDCWEYNQSTDKWSLIASFPLEVQGRMGPVGFSIDGVAFVGLGKDSLGNYLNDFWSLQLPTSVKEIAAPIGGVFPNPVRDNLTVKVDVEKAVFSLYDLSGKVILETHVIFGENMIRVNAIPNGTYLYQIQNISDKNVSAGKILKAE